MSYFVTMVDTFMSGWGKAKGRINLYVVECDTPEQAEQIEAAARDREEMIYITTVDKRPSYPKYNILTSRKHYSDLGGCWIEQGGRL